jgi:hypothetical protein
MAAANLQAQPIERDFAVMASIPHAAQSPA